MKWLLVYFVIWICFFPTGCKSFDTSESEKEKPVGASVTRDLNFGRGFLGDSDFNSQEKFSELLKSQLEKKINTLSDVLMLQQKPKSRDLDVCLAGLLKENKSYQIRSDSFDWNIDAFDVSSCFKQDLYSEVKVKLKMKLAAYCEGDSLQNYEKNLLDSKQWNMLFKEVCRKGVYRGLLLQIQFGLEGELKNKENGGVVSSSQKQVRVLGNIIKSISSKDSRFCISQRTSNNSVWSLKDCQWFNSSQTSFDVLEKKTNVKSSQKIYDATRLFVSQANIDNEKKYLLDSQADFNLNNWQGKMTFTNGTQAPMWSLALPQSSQVQSGVFRPEE